MLLRKVCFFVFALLSVGLSFGETIRLEWLTSFGTSSADRATAISVAEDGDIFLVGHTEGNLAATNAGWSTDVFVSKLNSVGNRTWTTQFGGRMDDQAWQVTPTENGGSTVVAHLTSESIRSRSRVPHQVSFDRDGAIVEKQQMVDASWWRSSLPAGAYMSAIVTDGDGAVYVAGAGHDPTDGHGSYDIDAFAAKVRLDGELEWYVTRGTESYDQALDITLAPDGSVYIVGFDNEASLDPNGTDGAFLTKINPTGAIEWTENFGNEGGYLGSVVVDDYGTVLVSGSSSSFAGLSPGAFVASFSPEGNLLGSLSLSRSFNQIRDMSLDNHGNVYLVGSRGAWRKPDVAVAKVRYIPEPPGAVMGLSILACSLFMGRARCHA